MPALLLTEREQDALSGLPHLAIVLYLALRRRMDYRTAIVGAAVGVSWQALTEDAYVEPGRGEVQRAPGREAVRRGAAWLVRAGLVEMRSNAAQARLVFFLPMASTLSRARNQPDRNPTGEPDRVATEGKPTETRQGRKRETRQTSGNGVIQSAAAAATASGIEKERAAAAAVELLFPKGTTRGQREAIARMLNARALDREAAQLVLDELAGIMRSKSVANPPALAAAIADQLARGELYALHAERERGGGRSLSPDELRFIDEGGRA